MNISALTIQDLFSQLGLAYNENQIRAFIEQHRPLPPGTTLTEAEFWNEAQVAFLKEAIAEDSDWCFLVDQLDCYLREQFSWIENSPNRKE